MGGWGRSLGLVGRCDSDGRQARAGAMVMYAWFRHGLDALFRAPGVWCLASAVCPTAGRVFLIPALSAPRPPPTSQDGNTGEGTNPVVVLTGIVAVGMTAVAGEGQEGEGGGGGGPGAGVGGREEVGWVRMGLEWEGRGVRRPWLMGHGWLGGGEIA